MILNINIQIYYYKVLLYMLIYKVLLQYTIIYIQETWEIPNLSWKHNLTNKKSKIQRQLCDFFIFVPLASLKFIIGKN